MLCSLLFVNEVVKRDEKKMYYLLGDGGEGSLEALRRPRRGEGADELACFAGSSGTLSFALLLYACGTFGYTSYVSLLPRLSLMLAF